MFRLTTTAVISFHEVKDRLDAEFYKSDYLHVEKALTTLARHPKFRIKPLAQLSKKIRKGIFYILKEEYKKKGVPFIRVSDIKNLTIDRNNLVYISEEKNFEEKKTSLKSGDLVISKSGTLGLVGLIPDDITVCNISQDIIGVSLTKEILPEYLAIFLTTKFGSKQLERGRSQVVQAHLELKYVRNLRAAIPHLVFQEKIKLLVTKALANRREAEHLYHKAMRSLLKKFGMTKLNLIRSKTNVVTFTEFLKSKRFDAEYHKPEFGQVITTLENSPYKLKNLGEVIGISKRQINPLQEPEREFTYIELANVSPSTGEITDCSKILGHMAPSRARMHVSKNDVLVPSLSGSLGNVTIIPEQLDGAVASTGFFVIRSNFFCPEFLFLLFRSILVKKQLEQKTTGTIMAAISHAYFRNVMIPLIPKDEQIEIVNMVKKSIELFGESRNLISNAMGEVETLIENALGGNPY